MGELKDMTGQRFSRLTVIERAGSAAGRATWRCSCSCGGETVVTGKSLRSGNTRSCGCLGREWSAGLGANADFIAKRSKSRQRHGHKRVGNASPEYKTWLGIKRRCSSPSSKDYAKYGGRGIRVCPEWDSSFETFLSDMGPKPSPRHQIDRENPNADYSAANCRWVTPAVQGAENKRNLVPVSVHGMDFPSLSAAARHFGLKKTAVNYRLSAGMTLEQVFTPGRARPRRALLPSI